MFHKLQMTSCQQFLSTSTPLIRLLEPCVASIEGQGQGQCQVSTRAYPRLTHFIIGPLALN